jgi:hypothetical protein
MKRMSVVLFVGLLLCLFCFPVYADTYSFTTLNDPSATWGTYPFGIYDGNIVGYSDDATGAMVFCIMGQTGLH